MGLTDDFELRDATLDDLLAIGMLRRSVDWSVHEWALRAVLDRADARCVVVEDRDGALVAAGSGIAYPPIGFVGNMVVVPDQRRRGIGSAVLGAIASWLAGAGCTRLELNASDDGMPLYAAHGFVSRGASSVARVPRGTIPDVASVHPRPATPADLDQLAGYDRPRFGGDRSAVLRLLLGDPACRAAVAELGGVTIGYAMVRLDEPRLGPLVADTPEVAAALLRWAFSAIPASDEMRLNLPPANRAGAAWLRGIGVRTEAWSGRMARGPEVPRRDETIYQMVVGPLG